MKPIIEKKNVWLFMIMALITLIDSANGQGTLIIQHFGDNDPTSEGFNLNIHTGQTVGPTNNDLGMSAWITAIPAASSTLGYAQSLTSQQESEIIGADWIMSVTLRIVYSDPSNPFGNIFVNFNTGLEAFSLLFGSNSNGDPFVRASSTSAFVLNGIGSTYNNYQLIYDSSSDTANLWVNGVEEIENINGQQSPQTAGLDWGIAQSGPTPYQANWNLMSLEIIPEPTAISLIFLGSGVLFYVRRNQ